LVKPNLNALTGPHTTVDGSRCIGGPSTLCLRGKIKFLDNAACDLDLWNP